ncbi:di-heme oxidoredictase family protein [Flavobacterium sp. DG1-102-2]|uniref:di-heme oxidoreductase family protein n=1 Tax=Flavobacterium sp. DG1-102-2 TaxID=3081663 RepID=UPI002949A1E3|nr:di-heme oxidoredictase family protein [Flavobacterium sp. DG1-102-2]MDV6169932.1 di-heme oxidoredictase family protein [Flavobacterium sp. DG1-102-2]
MKKYVYALVATSLFIAGCSKDDSSDYVPLGAEAGEEFSGGVATVSNATEEAFGFAYNGLSASESTDFGVGNSFFRQSWVSAPSSTTARDGLGPFYNAVACASCHFKDGRGRPPLYDGELGRGLLLRLSIPGMDPHGGPLADPTYGGQLQDNAILGPIIKGQIGITYKTITETFDDGTSVELKKPIYTINNLGYGSLASGPMISPRVGNQIIGLGLLEAVPDAAILGFADEFDNDGDGISGRPNYVYDIESNSQKLGRFGWKANQPNVKQQVAAAFSNDMGITSYMFPNENCPPGVDCGSIPNGGTPEIADLAFDRVVLYSRVLAVPIRRNHNDQDVLNGKKLFNDMQCVACHKPKMQTGDSYFISGYQNQTIRPYTDLLLHDMGENLADNATDFLASGSEWRTPPLWGIGLVQTVNKHTNFLHDGRARNLMEAILWHGGEAQAAKEKFKKLSAKEREDVIRFLNSL